MNSKSRTPTKRHYIVLGQGALGSHLLTYFRFLEKEYSITFQSFSARNILKNPEDFLRELAIAKEFHAQNLVILYASRDQATSELHSLLESIIKKYEFAENIINQVALSASLVNSQVEVWHPLMTFVTEAEYSYETYKEIPFVGCSERARFLELFPFFQNPSFHLPREKMREYHAHAFLAVGVSQFVWNEFSQYLLNNFHSQNEMMFPILRQFTRNLQLNAQKSSGPLVRGEFALVKDYINSFASGEFKSPHGALISELLLAFVQNKPRTLERENMHEHI